MIIEKFFPTIIYGKDVELDNDQLTRDIVNWSKQDKGMSRTNINGWHSTTDMGSKPEYQKLVTELLRMQKEIYAHENLDRHAILGNMWANINPPGGMNMPHLHPNALFSGVYYVKAPINSGRLKLIEPRPGMHVMMPVKKPGDPEINGSARKAELQSIKQTATDCKELIIERQRLEQMVKDLKSSGEIDEAKDYTGGFAERFSK